MDGSVTKYTFIYNDNFGFSPQYFFVPSVTAMVECVSMCSIFQPAMYHHDASYTVTVFASNLVGGGPRYTSQPISEPKVECSSSNITCESLD